MQLLYKKSEKVHKGVIDTLQRWREAQQRLLVVREPKELAYLTGMNVETIYRLKRAEYQVSARTSVLFANIQASWDYLRWVAEQACAKLLLPMPLLDDRPSMLLMADLAMAFGHFFELAGRVQEEEALNDEQEKDL